MQSEAYIQVVLDNSDTKKYFANGKLSTHSLAMISTQESVLEEKS